MPSIKVNVNSPLFQQLQDVGDREKRIRKYGKIGAGTIAAEILEFLAKGGTLDEELIQQAVEAARHRPRYPGLEE